jgi:hypothetical protein
MKLLNTIIKIAQAYVAFKICYILYFIKTDPRHHSIDDVLWWVSLLILDIWLNLVVLYGIKQNTEIDETNDVEVK